MLFRKLSLKAKPDGLRPSNLAIFFLIKCTMINSLHFPTNLSASLISRGGNSLKTCKKSCIFTFDHPVIASCASKASLSGLSRELEYGVIRCIKEDKEVNVYFNLRDCRPREVPRFCDKVRFLKMKCIIPS